MLLSFLALLFLFELNVRPAVSRVVLPAMFALSFIYAIGMDNILSRYKNAGKILFASILLVSIGFVGAEVIKFNLGKQSWNAFEEDFNWVKQNTNKDDIFFNGGQCVQFRLGRETIFPTDLKENSKLDYVWINQNFKLEPQTILTDTQLKNIRGRNLELVYENSKTGTTIHKVLK